MRYGTLCMVGHGDGLGPGDATYKVLKKVFTSPLGQTLFRTFHPDWGVKLARGWSKRSRAQGEHPMGKLEDEHLVQHAMSVLEDSGAPSPDVFIFGHRHHPVHAPLPQGDAVYLNLGDWLTHMTSAVIHEGQAELIDHKKGIQA